MSSSAVKEASTPLTKELQSRGWSSEEIRRVKEDESLLNKFRLVVRGLAEISPIIHSVDQNLQRDHLERNEGVERHNGIGAVEVEFQPQDQSLIIGGRKIFVSTFDLDRHPGLKVSDVYEQKQGNPFGVKIRDYLVTHPELIPDNWKEYGRIFFLGTILRHSSGGGPAGRLLAPGLEWNRFDEDRWSGTSAWFSEVWEKNYGYLSFHR